MIRKYYLSEWLFFRKKLLAIFVILSLLSISMPFLYYDYYIDHPDRAQIMANYRKTLHTGSLYTVNKFTLIVRLFWNNLIVTLRSTISGFVPFLFLSGLTILGLSIETGIVLSYNELFLKLDTFSLLMTMVPHGIFEFPAIIYASSLGIYLTIQTSKMIIPKFRSKTSSLQTLCEQAARSFILIVIPLLVIAAFVEVLVTPRLFPR